MAIGALNAIKAAGRLKEIAIWGVGGMIDGCNAIKAGEMFGTALQLSDLIGVYTVRAAYDLKIGNVWSKTRYLRSPADSCSMIRSNNCHRWSINRETGRNSMNRRHTMECVRGNGTLRTTIH